MQQQQVRCELKTMNVEPAHAVLTSTISVSAEPGPTQTTQKELNEP